MAKVAKKVPRKRRASVTPQTKFQKLREELSDSLLERYREIEGVLVALLAREHVLLLGPPGTAKTLLTELVAMVLGSTYFYWLMTKFTAPEEVFGNLSLKALKEDRTQRITDGMLPEAEIAFLDECFKANSSILNSLLTLLNERRFHNDGQAVDCPLQTMVGASNELPEGEELEALYDRFALRYWTTCVSNSAIRDLLGRGGDIRDRVTIRINAEELERAQAEVEDVVIPDHILDLLVAVKIETEKAGYFSTDRRWVQKVPAILRAAAYLDGCDEVSEDHLMVLAHMLWRDPKDAVQLGAIIAKVASPVTHAVQEILDAAKEQYRTIPFNEDVADDRTSEVFNQVVEVNAMLGKAIEKLNKLTNGKPNRKVVEAVEELQEMKREAGSFAGKVSGLDL